MDQVKNTGIRFIGWKDVCLAEKELGELTVKSKRCGLTTFLEIVTFDEDKHFKVLNLAIRLGVDYVIGGLPKFSVKTLKFLKTHAPNVRFFPYVGEIVGHPVI
jgi:hypothetical protein